MSVLDFPSGPSMNGNKDFLGPIAELHRVTFGFRGRASRLLRDVSVRVFPGETVLLAGANGSGKSTILGLLSGRLAPQAGTVRVLGSDPLQADRLPAVALITEPFHPSQSPLPVEMSVRRVLNWLEIIDRVHRDAARQCMDQLRLSDDLLDRRLDRLSKGERQRVMLMVALLRRPRLILADEPLDGVDSKSRAVISAVLAEYAKQNMASIVWVEHHLIEAARYANRILRIDDGAIVEDATARYSLQFGSDGDHVEMMNTPTLYLLPDLIAERMAGGAGVVELTVRTEGRV